MAYFRCVGGSGGAGATITVTYSSQFYNKTMTCTKGTKTYTKTTTSSGSTVFDVDESGTWTITCNGVSRTVDVVLEYSTQMAITKTITVYGAASDTISFTDMTGAKTVTTDSNGEGSVVITFIPPSASITFTSSIAKNPNNLSQAYSKTITIDNNTTSIYVMPDNALYWYGNECSWITNGWNGNGYSLAGYSNPNTVQKTTNYINLDLGGSGNSINMIGTDVAINLADYTKYTCIGYKGSSIVSALQNINISSYTDSRYVCMGASRYSSSYWQNLFELLPSKSYNNYATIFDDHNSSPQAIKIYAIFLES